MIVDHQACGGPEQAARITCAMQEEAQRLFAEQTGQSLAIGLNSGQAVVGVLGSPSVRLDLTAIGDPVNVAARLAEIAQGLPNGGVVVSQEWMSTCRESPDVKDLSNTQVRGRKQAVQAYQFVARDS